MECSLNKSKMVQRSKMKLSLSFFLATYIHRPRDLLLSQIFNEIFNPFNFSTFMNSDGIPKVLLASRNRVVFQH